MKTAAQIYNSLRKQAKETGKNMNEMLIIYGLERTIYRISVSKYKENFTLKGGILLYAIFEGEFSRATRDIDLLAYRMPNSILHMEKVFRDIFALECDDALEYMISTLEVKSITEMKDYNGVSINIKAYLDDYEIPISIDIGFGDIIYPERTKMKFPVLLDMKTPKVYAYSIYSVISEKFEAIVSLGNANSRYKDFYDIYTLATTHDLEGEKLKEAIIETFDHRGTSFDDIVAFEDGFADEYIHKNRWNSFVKNKKAMLNVSFRDAVDLIKSLLQPIVWSIRDNSTIGDWNNKKRKWGKKHN